MRQTFRHLRGQVPARGSTSRIAQHNKTVPGILANLDVKRNPLGSARITRMTGKELALGHPPQTFVGQIVLATAAASVLLLVTSLSAGSEPSVVRRAVISQAHALAAKPFDPPPPISSKIGEIGYDQYNDIRYHPEKRLWAGQGTGFEVDFRHIGFIYKHPIEVFVVEDGQTYPIEYDDELFDFGPSEAFRERQLKKGFSGIRLWSAIDSPASLSEFLVFQGASYFRSRGPAQGYGLSARALAVDTAEPQGEEFPLFRSFWLERPALGAESITVHALVDSKRVTGAFQFRITPGPETIVETDATIFTRSEVAVIGLAPLTSMYLFGPVNRHRYDDFRSAVHDSDGLLMWRGNGEWLWRALTNPTKLQVSMFIDENVRGFGLMQRASEFVHFQDLEARYEKRPSAWIEPKGHWGRGSVELVEIPTNGEFNDNIVAFWRPENPIAKGETKEFSYVLRWGAPTGDPQLAQVSATRAGRTLHDKKRLYVVDFVQPKETYAQLNEQVEIVASASQGKISNVVGRPNISTGGYRVSFEFQPGSEDLSELSLVLKQDKKPISEKWLFRWHPD